MERPGNWSQPTARVGHLQLVGETLASTRRQASRRSSPTLPSCSPSKAAPIPLSDDERLVALDPAVRGEDEEVEPDSERLAVLGDRLPVELDDVAEPVGVVAPPEAEPLGADPVLVRARRPSLYRLVSLCVRITSAIAARLG